MEQNHLQANHLVEWAARLHIRLTDYINRNYKSLCRGLLIYQIWCRNISRRAAERAEAEASPVAKPSPCTRPERKRSERSQSDAYDSNPAASFLDKSGICNFCADELVHLIPSSASILETPPQCAFVFERNCWHRRQYPYPP